MGSLSEQGETLVYRWAHSDEPEAEDQLCVLTDADKTGFPHATVYPPQAAWIFDGVEWVPGRAADDLTWALGKLRAAVASWQQPGSELASGQRPGRYATQRASGSSSL